VILLQSPVSPLLQPGDGFYALYFSRAVALEADLMAEHVARAGVKRLLQVARCGAVEAAVARVKERLPAGIEVSTRCYAGDPTHALEGLDPAKAQDAAVALWLDPADAGRVIEALPAKTGAVYVSSSLLGSRPIRFASPLAGRVLMLEPQVPAVDLERHAWRSLVWLKARELQALPARVSLNALYSMLLAAEALTHPTALVSREYFVERIEGMAARSPHRSAYPELVFGPQRHFGSAGGYVLQVPPSPEGAYRKVGEWTVPRS
jgi:hypothetical protein